MPVYATAAADRAEQAPPIEPISSVNQHTASTLADANDALCVLLTKVRGSQPSEVGNKLGKMPERHVLGDARNLRELAAHVYEQIQELHRIIGHDKQ